MLAEEKFGVERLMLTILYQYSINTLWGSDHIDTKGEAVEELIEELGSTFPV